MQPGKTSVSTCMGDHQEKLGAVSLGPFDGVDLWQCHNVFHRFSSNIVKLFTAMLLVFSIQSSGVGVVVNTLAGDTGFDSRLYCTFPRLAKCSVHLRNERSR